MGAFFSKPVVVLDYQLDFSNNYDFEEIRLLKQIDEWKDLCINSIVEFFAHLFPIYTREFELFIRAPVCCVEVYFESIKIVGVSLGLLAKAWYWGDTLGSEVYESMIRPLNLEYYVALQRALFCRSIKMVPNLEQLMKTSMELIYRKNKSSAEIFDSGMAIVKKLLKNLESQFLYVQYAYKGLTEQFIVNQDKREENSTKSCDLSSKSFDCEKFFMMWIKLVAINVGAFRLSMLEFIRINQSTTFYLSF